MCVCVRLLTFAAAKMVLGVKVTCSWLTRVTLGVDYQQLAGTNPRVWMARTIDAAHRVTRTRKASGGQYTQYRQQYETH